MSKIVETGLILKQETKFDKIRKLIYQIFFKEEYRLDMEIEKLINIHRPNPKDIIIPREIRK